MLLLELLQQLLVLLLLLLLLGSCIEKVMPSVRARGRTGMSQREVGRGSGLPRGRVQNLSRFRRWPVASVKVDMAAPRCEGVL